MDHVLFADVLNVYGGPAGLQPEFNILTAEIVDEEEETLPLLGLIVEYAWSNSVSGPQSKKERATVIAWPGCPSSKS